MLATVHPRGARTRALSLALYFAAFAGAFAARAGTGTAPLSPPAKHATFETFREAVSEPIFDDLPGLLKRGKIRVAVTYSKTHYFVDKGQQRGFAYENLTEF